MRDIKYGCILKILDFKVVLMKTSVLKNDRLIIRNKKLIWMKRFFGNIFRRFKSDDSQSFNNQTEITDTTSPIFSPATKSYTSTQPISIPKSPQIQPIKDHYSPSQSRSKSEFSLRSVKKRASITPEQFRKSLQQDPNDSSQFSLSQLNLDLSDIQSPFSSSFMPTPKNQNKEKTEIFDFEKSAKQTPIVPKKRQRPGMIALQPPIRLVYTERMKQGEIEKRACLFELSKLTKNQLITEEERDLIFSNFASQLDHFNQKKSKEDQLLSKQAKEKGKEPTFDPSKSPEEIIKECQKMVDRLRDEAELWSNVEMPPVSLNIPEIPENEITLPKQINLESIYLSQELITNLDHLSKIPQSMQAQIEEIEEEQNELALMLNQIAPPKADILMTVLGTKRG